MPPEVINGVLGKFCGGLMRIRLIVLTIADVVTHPK